ncbi:hypothetical protein PWT90_10481 [Aphanocladium album]|nr:hypothetical protein PWT90_10481 [Aphanocladium album]
MPIHERCTTDQESQKATEENIEIIEPNPAESRRLLKKIDMCLLPVMAVSYMFQFLDKSALSYTSILGLREDLHLSGSQFSWANSVYYFGYLIASYPLVMLMVRFPVTKVLAISLAVWGTIMMLTAVCHNYQGLWANRFFLGTAEAALAPGLTVIISMWYKRSEQPLRQAAWFLGNTFAGIIGGMLAYGIGHVKAIAAWKAVFLIFGAATIVWSAVMLFFLPDEPSKARFLKRAEREAAIRRVESNMTGTKSSKIVWSQCVEALCDVQAWILVLMQFCTMVANGGIQGFGSIVIHGLGFGTLKTLQLQMVVYVFQLIFVLIATIGSSYFVNTRTFWMAFDLSIAIVGAVMLRQLTDSQWGQFFGYCLTMAYTPNLPLILSMLSGNIAGFTKKMTVNAMLFIAYCLGNIVGPQLFLEKEAPHYTTGFLAIMICCAISILGSMLLRGWLIWENNRRSKLAGSTSLGGEAQLNDGDQTDKTLIQFRYLY